MIVNFGKYKGKNIDLLLDDENYVRWMILKKIQHKNTELWEYIKKRYNITQTDSDKTNLNTLFKSVYPYGEDKYIEKDHSIIGDEKDIEVYFENIETHIINKIRKYDYVVGYIAWLTNENILKELANKKSVLIVIQEEDFLRPDIKFKGDKLKWKNKIKKLYDELESDEGIYLGFEGINCANLFGFSGIRRMGKLNTDKSPAFPRMHNKFIICFNKNDEEVFIKKDCIIGEVLTGSFNYTENSNYSLENVVCIKDNKVISSYFSHFSKICSLTVPLDWDGNWEPNKGDIRYGT